jgi:hypothetical protein
MIQNTRRLALILAAAGSLVVVTVGVAAAQQYPPKLPTCSVAQGTVSPGDSVTVSGQNWLAGSTVDVSLQGDGSLGTADVNGQGSFSVVVTIPSSVSTGSIDIVCSGTKTNGKAFVLGTTISIVGAGGGLLGTAFTGAQIQMWMFLALVLFGIGLGLILVSRRRRSSLLR